MHKYSKLRIVFAVIVVSLGVQIALMGVSLSGRYRQISSYIQRGFHERVARMEKDYYREGLKDGYDKADFDRKFSEFKMNFARVEKGEVVGGLGIFLEKIIVLLCFITAVLFFMNAVLALVQHPFLDVCVKCPMAAIAAIMISLFWYILHPAMITLQITEGMIHLQAMLKNTGNIQVMNKYSMLRSIIFSEAGILFLVLILLFCLFYCALPYGLYVWVKNREKSADC